MDGDLTLRNEIEKKRCAGVSLFEVRGIFVGAH